MESKVYSLIEPYKIKEVIEERKIKEGWALVQSKMGSICHADLRYFTGSRAPEVLKEKLPMALIHEGIGEVYETNNKNLKKGDRVIIVPNIPGRIFNKQEENETDKYSREGQFMGSGYNGISQSIIAHPVENLIKIPNEIPDEIAVLGEMQSVSISAIREHENIFSDPNLEIAVIGDGPVGFFAAAYLKYKYGLPSKRLTVFGADENKLKAFDFTNTDNSLTSDLSKYDSTFDVIIEATGGKFAEDAINQAIDMLDFKGHLILMGVSEELVPVNTRDVLEKGLSIFGSSRSTVEDFKEFIELLKKSEKYSEILSRILPDTIRLVKNDKDFANTLLYAAETPHWNKIIMEFDWESEEK